MSTGLVEIHEKLPAGWAWSTLGVLQPGRSATVNPSRQPDTEFELYSVPSFEIGAPEIVLGKNVGSTKQHVLPGTTLVCKINPRINRVWVVGPERGRPQIASTEWIAFSPSEVDPTYLQYFMRQTSFRNYLALNVSGVGGSLMRVRPALLQEYSIPFAPKQEQVRIAAQLDNLFSRIGAGEKALTKTEALLKTYRQSVLKAAVTGELTREWRRNYKGQGETGQDLLKRILKTRREAWERRELAKMKTKGKTPKDEEWKEKYEEPGMPDTSTLPELPLGWAWARLEQLGFVESGQTPKGIDELAGSDGEVPWFKVSSMNTRGNEEWLSSSAWYLSRSQAVNLGLHVRPAGTIVFPKRGGAIMTNKKRRLKHTGAYDLNLMGFVPVEPLGEYLWTYFLGLDLSKICDGSNVPQINYDDVADLICAVPPVNEGQAAAQLADSLLQAATHVGDQVVASQRLGAERLRQSTLRAAFAGQLVSQDPADEPASVLLERLTTEPITNARRKTRPISDPSPKMKAAE